MFCPACVIYEATAEINSRSRLPNVQDEPVSVGISVGPHGMAGIFTVGAAGPATPQLGDLTPGEITQIQSVVDEAGRPLEVVGSSASATRGLGSDIDYLVPPGSVPYYRGLEQRLPSIDPKSGIIVGTHNPFIGPGIRFEPGVKPAVIKK